MIIPDYKDGNIVNLMSSIASSFGVRLPYSNLKALSASELKQKKNTVLIILDGLGYEFLKKKAQKSFLMTGLRTSLTSVCPSTTAAAITAFATGLPAQQHASTAWHMHIKEVGGIMTILPFVSRFGEASFSKYNLKVDDILDTKNFLSNKIKASTYAIVPQNILDSEFNRTTLKNAKKLSYNNLNGFFRQIKKAINSHNQRKYISAYWPYFDAICHKKGISSRSAELHFKEIDKHLSRFMRSVEGTDTNVIIVSDHGLIDIPKSKGLWLEDHPEMNYCLSMPLCGEPRFVYCYVHPSKAKQFEKYVKTKLNHACLLYKTEDLIKKNYFGLFKPSPKLFDRLGDYILIMKEDYSFKDRLLKQKKKQKIGMHGGLSKDEMLIPLCVFEC